TEEDRTDRLLRAISGDDGDAVLVHQDAHVFVSRLNAGTAATHELDAGRGAYLYVIEGDVSADGEPMVTGSAAQIVDEPALEIRATATSELILVDVGLT
ncbi:MAG TPA: pirin family protein, partial [Actinomycetota bacterium]|nr:pirin family protein [Actinomycetota bacterium]